MGDALYSVTEEGGGRTIRSFVRSNVVQAHLEHTCTVQTSCKLEGSRVPYALGARFTGILFGVFHEVHDNARVANKTSMHARSRLRIAQTRLSRGRASCQRTKDRWLTTCTS